MAGNFNCKPVEVERKETVISRKRINLLSRGRYFKGEYNEVRQNFLQTL